MPVTALFHKAVRKVWFSNIILRWISIHLKSIIRSISLLTTIALINRGNLSICLEPNTQYPIPNTQYPIPNTQWYVKAKGKHSRNQTYADTITQCCLMIKSLFRLSFRMITGFVQSVIKTLWIPLHWTTQQFADGKSILILQSAIKKAKMDFTHSFIAQV